LIFWKYSLRRI